MTIEDLRKRSKLRLIVMSLSMTLPIFIVFLLGFGGFEFGENSVFLVFEPLPYIVCGVFLAWLIYKVCNYAVILRNDKYAEKVLIKKNDERNKFIKVKSYGLASQIFIYVMGVGCILTAFIDKSAFYSFLAVFGAFVLIEVIVRIVYKKIY